jgi:hypothetical protein
LVLFFRGPAPRISVFTIPETASTARRRHSGFGASATKNAKNAKDGNDGFFFSKETSFFFALFALAPSP